MIGSIMLIICLLFALPGIALALAGERRGRRTIVLLGKGVAPAAVLFYVSDLFVARQVFIRRSFLNPALGLPLYYAAQYLFASTVGR